MAFVDYQWTDPEEFDTLRDKFNNAMALADEIPVVPVGTILPWWGNPNDVSLFDGNGNGVAGSVMAKFALCLGQPLTESQLKTYTGATQSTAPNMKGKFPVGWDPLDTTAHEHDQIGSTGGAKKITLDTAHIPAHTHTYNDNEAGDSDNGSNLSGSGEGHMINQQTTAKTTGSTGGGQPFENRPPFVTTGFIIRYK